MGACVCVRACRSVCWLVCLSVVVVEPHHRRSACSSPPSQHAATETLPEIFNSVAAVNSAATLESMSHGQGGERSVEETSIGSELGWTVQERGGSGRTNGGRAAEEESR